MSDDFESLVHGMAEGMSRDEALDLAAEIEDEYETVEIALRDRGNETFDVEWIIHRERGDQEQVPLHGTSHSARQFREIQTTEGLKRRPEESLHGLFFKERKRAEERRRTRRATTRERLAAAPPLPPLPQP